MTKRPKDHYRLKLYAAEETLRYSVGFGHVYADISEAQQFVHMVQAADSLLSGLPWITVQQAHGNAKASWAVFAENMISLTREGLNVQIILHELAHLATGPKYSYHGKEFAWNYLDLSLNWRGVKVYKELRDAIRAQGII